ncbi:hypothetical protein BpHYR1_001896 [Brachionus plicatilis]|uniref:Uncharacterized protein n=1 Tax=Brachionus plicatilis TaxID=10195 RepID=A0A3M7SJ70_BRAPC|nr:hypothetical protein BpHYR1_001896 [Brachionus plicatilis]
MNGFCTLMKFSECFMLFHHQKYFPAHLVPFFIPLKPGRVLIAKVAKAALLQFIKKRVQTS